jgi:3-dehydroshikimate dehydratase
MLAPASDAALKRRPIGLPVMRLGMCSVTLRAMPVDAVLGVAVDAGLACVEWGGDVHVPCGDLATAETVRARTADAGLAVASYGSYLRCGRTDAAEIARTVATAAVLDAPRIRVWAGVSASIDASQGVRDEVARDARRLVDEAAASGLTVAFEFHGGTLTDDPASALRLLADAPGTATYWQPPNNVPDATVLAGLDRVLPQVAAAHVFSWWPRTHRLPLGARKGMWRKAFARLKEHGELDCLLEFVPGDDPALVRRETDSLRQLIEV